MRDISQLTPVNSFVATRQGWRSFFSTASFLYLLTADIKVNNDQSVQTTTILQEFKHFLVGPRFTSAVDNVVHAKNSLNFATGANTNAASSQRFTSGNSLGQFYDCEIASQGNMLKSVAKTCDQTIKFK